MPSQATRYRLPSLATPVCSAVAGVVAVAVLAAAHPLDYSLPARTTAASQHSAVLPAPGHIVFGTYLLGRRVAGVRGVFCPSRTLAWSAHFKWPIRGRWLVLNLFPPRGNDMGADRGGSSRPHRWDIQRITAVPGQGKGWIGRGWKTPEARKLFLGRGPGTYTLSYASFRPGVRVGPQTASGSYRVSRSACRSR